MTNKVYPEDEVIRIATVYDEIGHIYGRIDDAIMDKEAWISVYRERVEKMIDQIPKELHPRLEKIAKLEAFFKKKE
ncbi:MAG: hypothetical protein AABY03_01075 [Nanoarchaeota archaeon]